MVTPATSKSDARQRILETAERLFYAEGFRAVGVDRIIAEADVAKMTLYKHFPGKDDLLLAVLEYRDAKVTNMFSKSIEKYIRRGKSPLEAFFASLKKWFESPGFRGCAFINAAMELADASHPAARFSSEHKVRFRGLIQRVVAETTSAAVAAEVAPAISLLVEGAVVTAVMEESSRSADVAREAALALVSKSKRR